jgi:sterol desaturase/sphingolipid hydroxylase (fatty acid hydroxylase superfamily)
MIDWLNEQGMSGPILFAGYFFLYGLEYFFPLVKSKSTHFWTNAGLAVVLVGINILFTSITIAVSDAVQANDFGFFNQINAGTAVMIAVSIVFLDFWAGYFAHLIFHKNAWLWRLHTIHHSDDHVDVTTAFRQHPIESIIRIMFNLSGMALLGIPSWMLLIYLTLSTIHAQIEHANIRLPASIDRILQLVIVTPNMHKIHHSKFQPETDSNYSNIFSVWDRLFNTYTSRNDYKSIAYGLDFLDGKSYAFWDLVSFPFRYFRRLNKGTSVDKQSVPIQMGENENVKQGF